MTNDPNQKGKLYEFNVPANAKVKYRTSYVTGHVFDAVTKKPLKAGIELYDLKNEAREGFVYSDSVSGEYLMVLTEGSDYALYVNKPDYLFESLSFEYQLNEDLQPVKLDIYLKPISEGAKAVLNNIFFDVDSYALKDKSRTELNKLISFLNANPNARIEIGGHTDNTGSGEYNLDLSLRRAKSVYDFLIEKGINKARLKYKGYGQNMPAFPNDSDLHRQMNRRIEFQVIK